MNQVNINYVSMPDDLDWVIQARGVEGAKLKRFKNAGIQSLSEDFLRVLK
ncbi:MAG: hypothetical protein ABL925_05245 [Methylococcales bacterium]